MEELTNAINLKNTHPITDEVGKNLKPFRFKLTNTCGVGVDYNVNLEVMETESRIASKNIATKVDENTKSILSNNPTAPITYQESDYTAVEAYTIHSGSIEPYGSVEHEVRIWLDESAGNDSQNGTFYSKVVIDARQNQIIAINFNEYIINQVEDNPSIEEFTHEATSQTPALTDYRYTRANPNNYVYFGCEEDCTLENLYRIIGVIPTQSEVGGEYENRVKLIKNTEYIETESGYLRNSSGYRLNDNYTVKTSWLNCSLYKVLNTYYWNFIQNYQNYIEESIWYLGALSYSGNAISNYSSDFYYIGERDKTVALVGGNLSILANIGLMYPSDYGYSSGKKYHSDAIWANNAINLNTWLRLENNSTEWTIMPDSLQYSDSEGMAGFSILPSGPMTIYSVNAPTIRPTFYLKSNVLYESGSGTEENPYRISINE